MSVVFVLLPLALLIAGVAVALFIWAVRSGQYDDLDTPAVRILFDDEVPADGRRAAAGRPGTAPAAATPGAAGGRSQSR
jgi:cbb3-type cytochrome oxidase maturation protein